MEIEVGEYVRTNNGVIGKLIRIERDHIDIYLKWYVFYDGKKEIYINRPYITNYSFNIIDLIEVGDYLDILADGSPLRFEVDKIDFKHKLKNIANEVKIRSIVTIEQMASIEYKV